MGFRAVAVVALAAVAWLVYERAATAVIEVTGANVVELAADATPTFLLLRKEDRLGCCCQPLKGALQIATTARFAKMPTLGTDALATLPRSAVLSISTSTLSRPQPSLTALRPAANPIA